MWWNAQRCGHVLTQVSYHNATAGCSFEMVAQKAGGVLSGTWGWQRGCRSSGKESWGSTEASLHRGLLLTVPKLLAPANCQHLAPEGWLPFQESHSQRPRPSPFHGSRDTLSVSTGTTYMEEMPARLLIIFRAASAPPSSCTQASCCWSASNARALHRRPPVSNGCIVLQTHVSQSRHPCRPEASGLGNQSATLSMPSGRLRFPNASFVHGAPRRSCRESIPKVPDRFRAAPRACFPPPCRAELHMSTSDHRVYAASDVTWQVGSCSIQATAIQSSSDSPACHERESRTADDSNDDAVPSILPSVVRDLGCTTPGCLEASLVGCLQRKDSRRPSIARVSLDPVPWEGSGSLNAGRHRRGSGRAVQIVPPIRALVQQAPGSSTLGCISRRTLPNDGRPQASLPSVRSRGEHAQVVSQGHGQMHLAKDADRGLVSYCARPRLPLHTPTRSLPLLSPL